MGATIWKFRAEFADLLGVEMPVGAQVLSVQMQGSFDAFVWAFIPDTDAPSEMRYFRWVGTGNPAPDDLGTFIGTVRWQRLVFHLFESARP